MSSGATETTYYVVTSGAMLCGLRAQKTRAGGRTNTGSEVRTGTLDSRASSPVPLRAGATSVPVSLFPFSPKVSLSRTDALCEADLL